MENTPSIRVKDLSRKYGALTAIHKVNFTVNPGEVVGFLGPNGAGKSTTMRILSGIMSATSGSAWVGGICVAQNPHEVKRKIGYMPENNPLPDDMRVVEYLRFRSRLKEVPSQKLRSTVQEAMEISIRPHSLPENHWHTLQGFSPTRPVSPMPCLVILKSLSWTNRPSASILIKFRVSVNQSTILRGTHRHPIQSHSARDRGLLVTA